MVAPAKPRPSTFTSRLARAIGFCLVTANLFVVVLWLGSRITYAGHTLLQYATHNLLEPGGEYQSLRRFREVRGAGPLDIVFFGSSHGYRGFDPRIFAAAGYRAYNLSSTNQTPLNTYWLARRYLPELSPKLVVIEVYYHTLSTDGLESCRDLAVNTPSSPSMIRMAIATENLGAVTFALAKAMGLTADESRAEQRPVAGETYVEGGYCETLGHRDRLAPGEPISVEVRPRQLAYLQDTSAFARSLGARVVWVTHPFPADHRSRIAHHDEIRDRIASGARAAGVDYWDFDDRMSLDPLDDFQDFHHLNASGVAKFDRALLEALWASGNLERR